MAQAFLLILLAPIIEGRLEGSLSKGTRPRARPRAQHVSRTTYVESLRRAPPQKERRLVPTFPISRRTRSLEPLLRCKLVSGRLSVGESIQGVCLQEYLSPFIEKLAAQRLVEFNCRLISTQHFPANPIAAFLPGNTSDLRQKRSSYPSAAKRFPYEEVLQKDTGAFQA